MDGNTYGSADKRFDRQINLEMRERGVPVAIRVSHTMGKLSLKFKAENQLSAPLVFTVS